MSETLFDLLPGVESSDGYLTDAWLDRLRAFEFTCRNAAHFLLWLPNIKSNLACCDISLARGAGELGDRSHIVEFHTGGWSGAEDLIAAMLGHFWIRSFHTKWCRGGHYTFEIPVSILRGVLPSPTQRSRPYERNNIPGAPHPATLGKTKET